MSNRLTLDNEELVEEFYEDSLLLGIMASSMEAQRFVWQVNQSIRFDFRINDALEINIKRKGRTYYFPVFEYQEPGITLTYYLYKNQYDGEYLLPEFKHLDFLWLLKGDLPNKGEEALLIDDIKNIQGVQLVIPLTLEKMKNKLNLVL
jgi:hypothetical protein